MSTQTRPLPTEPGQGSAEVLLRLQDVGVAYGQRTVLKDITLQIHAGVTVLMGPSGTGKSTLLHLLAGLPASALRRHWGHITYMGQPLGDNTPQHPALMRQQPQDMRVPLIERLANGSTERTRYSPLALRQHLAERLQALGLQAMAQRLDSMVADLPPLLARQASLLHVAFSGARLLLLDEPTASLSEADTQQMLSLIRQLASQQACLVITHHQGHARQLADHAILLAGGHVQMQAPAKAFFENTTRHPVLAQFLRTGSCSVPSPDAREEDLDDSLHHVAAIEAPTAPAAPSLGTPEASANAAEALIPAHPEGTPALNESGSIIPSSASITPDPSAPPSSRGPSGFHWLVPGHLAGCPKPGVIVPIAHDLMLLKQMGVTMLVNLTENELPHDLLAQHGLKQYAMAIPDRHAPPLMWTKLLLAKMDAFMRTGEVLAVHCLAGLGRTGTILCAWLIREGLTAEEALQRLRRIDAGFVQSAEQEALLHELETNLLIRAR